MRLVFLVLFWIGYLCMMQAQAYLLPDFQLSIATGKRGTQPVQALFNYNCVTQSMEFKEGVNIMKLTPIDQIDTLYLGNHKMIPYAQRFLDVIYRSPEFSLLVDYKREVVNEGKRGAMGLKTQGTVENIDFSAIGGRHTEEWKKGVDVWEYKETNTYLYVVKSRMKRFHNAKTLNKIFPEKKEAINLFIKENDIRFDNIKSVLDLVLFCTAPM